MCYFRQNEGLCLPEWAIFSPKGTFVGPNGPFSGQDRDLSGQYRDLLGRKRALLDRKRALLDRKKALSNQQKGPLRPTKAVPDQHKVSSRQRAFLGRKISLASWQRTNLVPQMVLPKVGVAFARIGVALFEVGVARATPKVYKSPRLCANLKLISSKMLFFLLLSKGSFLRFSKGFRDFSYFYFFLCESFKRC